MGKIDTIYQDDDLIIINKPSGITVNNSETTNKEDTVQDWVVKEFDFNTTHKEMIDNLDSFVSETGFEPVEKTFIQRAGIVHRIDKETSGILLIAKNVKSFANMQKQFKDRTVKKKYLALAHGKISPKRGEINVPVGRLPWNRRQFGVVPGGREAHTLYNVTGYFRTSDKRKEVLSMVSLEPLTGRTHQIRVHLQYLGHAIFSDFLYAGRKIQREDRKYLERVFLHAAQISFSHPKTNILLNFEAEFPSELADLIASFTRIE